MAQTYKFGNGTFATKEGSLMSYNDEGGNFKPMPFSFSRNSIATRVNKEGLIEVVGKDIPRIDYTDSADGVLLLENSATNLLTYSEAFDNSYWTKSGSSVTSGFISPDGTNNAFKIIENIDNVEHYIKRSIANPIGFYTWSLFVKAEERKYIVFRTNADGGAYKNSCFDIEYGTIVYDGLHQSKAEIQQLNNGWFRISAYVKETSGTTRNYHIHISDTPITDNGAISYQGDGTSGVYIYGAMLEQGSHPTSYLPTSGSTYQRAAETANGSGNSEVFNDSSGVLFANISALSNDGTNRFVSINSGSQTNRVAIYFDTSNNLNGQLRVGGSTQASITDSSLNILNFNKVAFKYKQNDVSFYINGFQIGVDNNANVFTDGTLNSLNYDVGGGTLDFYGKTKEIAYYDEVLTDLELETLTSYRTWEEMVKELNLNIIHNE